MKKLLFSLLILALVLSSCKKDRFYSGSDAVLTFSADTLTFDTVFTTVGSITRYFKVTNPLKEAIKIDEIRLAGIPGDQFRINVDGQPGTSVFDIEIPAKDYIYIFAEVTVDPNNQSNPFVLLDEVQYFYNGQQQSSYLRAWGQNAYFHYGEIIEGDSIWQNDKPHVVIRTDSFPGVGVEGFGSLTILPGCKVYFNQNSGIFSDGPVVIGSPGCQDSVVLQTDRVEDLPNGLEYSTTAGLWLGVILRNGATGDFNNVNIRNATYGIAGRWPFDDFSSFSTSNQPVITMDKVQINYSAVSSLSCLNADVQASNCLFNDAGTNLVTLAMGGQYNFENCTLNGTGDGEALAVSDYASVGSQGGTGDLNNATFINCIVYGGNTDELLLNQSGGTTFNYQFDNCLIRTSLNTDTVGFTDCVINQNPLFDNVDANPFTLGQNSPCISAGKSNLHVFDLYCNTHNSPKDIGAVAATN